MYSLRDLENFDLERLDPTRLDLTRFDLPAETSRIAEFARDVAFAGVGAVATTAQKAGELRRELTEQVGEQARKLVDAIS